MNPKLSVTVIVKLKVLAAVGVPEITPLDGLSIVPVGRAPEVTAKVWGDVPPCAVIVSEYATPVVPPFSAAATGTGL